MVRAVIDALEWGLACERFSDFRTRLRMIFVKLTAGWAASADF